MIPLGEELAKEIVEFGDEASNNSGRHGCVQNAGVSTPFDVKFSINLFY